MALTVELKSGKSIKARAKCSSCDEGIVCLVENEDKKFVSTEELLDDSGIKTLGTVLFSQCPKLALKQKAA